MPIATDLKNRCLDLIQQGLQPVEIQGLTGVSRMTIAGWAFKAKHPNYEAERQARIVRLRPVYLSREWYEENSAWWKDE